MAKTTKPMAGLGTVEYRLQGMGLEATRASGGAGGGGAPGGGVFGTPPPVPGRPMSARVNYGSPIMDASQRELANMRAV